MEKLSLKKFEKKQLINANRITGGSDGMIHDIPDAVTTTNSSSGNCCKDVESCIDNIKPRKPS